MLLYLVVLVCFTGVSLAAHPSKKQSFFLISEVSEITASGSGYATGPQRSNLEQNPDPADLIEPILERHDSDIHESGSAPEIRGSSTDPLQQEVLSSSGAAARHETKNDESNIETWSWPEGLTPEFLKEDTMYAAVSDGHAGQDIPTSQKGSHYFINGKWGTTFGNQNSNVQKTSSVSRHSNSMSSISRQSNSMSSVSEMNSDNSGIVANTKETYTSNPKTSKDSVVSELGRLESDNLKSFTSTRSNSDQRNELVIRLTNEPEVSMEENDLDKIELIGSLAPKYTQITDLTNEEVIEDNDSGHIFLSNTPEVAAFLTPLNTGNPSFTQMAQNVKPGKDLFSVKQTAKSSLLSKDISEMTSSVHENVIATSSSPLERKYASFDLYTNEDEGPLEDKDIVSSNSFITASPLTTLHSLQVDNLTTRKKRTTKQDETLNDDNDVKQTLSASSEQPYEENKKTTHTDKDNDPNFSSSNENFLTILPSNTKGNSSVIAGSTKDVNYSRITRDASQESSEPTITVSSSTTQAMSMSSKPSWSGDANTGFSSNLEPSTRDVSLSRMTQASSEHTILVDSDTTQATSRSDGSSWSSDANIGSLSTSESSAETETIQSTLGALPESTTTKSTTSPVPLGEKCSNSSQCQHLPNATCKNDTCVCKKGYFKYNSTCYKRPNSPGRINILTVNETCFSANWSKPNGTVDEYKVQIFQGQDLKWNENKSLHLTQLEHCGFLPATDFMIKVSAVSDGVESLSSDSNKTSTKPGTPANGTVQRSARSNFTITWSSPLQGSNTSFKATAVLFNGTVSTCLLLLSTNDTIAAFYNCSKGSKYNVSLYTVYNGQESNPLVIPACTKPDGITNFRIQVNTLTSARLSWYPPGQGSVDAYTLTWYESSDRTSNNNNKSLNASTFAYDVTDLKAGTDYRFEINANFCNFTSKASLNYSTQLSVLRNVSIVAVHNSTKLNISWTRDEAVLDDESIYVELNVSSGTSHIACEKASGGFVVLDVHKYGICLQVDVTLVKGDKKGTPLTQFLSSSESAPDQVQNLTRERFASHTALNITWSSPSLTNGVVNRYVVIVKGERHFVNHTRILNCTENCSLICGKAEERSQGKENYFSNHTFIGGQQHFYTIFDDLSPFENYEVEIIAHTSAGQSSPAVIYIPDQLLDAVQNLSSQVINASCILLRWAPPINIKYTSVANYIMYYIMYYSNSCDVNSSSNISTINTSVLVCDLQFYTSYCFKILANDTNGKATTIKNQTDEDVPGNVANLTIMPEVDPYKSRAVNISWFPPIKTNGIIRVYCITVTNMNGEIVANETINVASQNFSSNHKWTHRIVLYTGNFSFEISASTSKGSGPPEKRDKVIPAGVLPKTEKSVVVFKLDQLTPDPATTAHIALPRSLLCNWTYGHPQEAGFIVSRAGQGLNDSRLTLGSNVPGVNKWQKDHKDPHLKYKVKVDANKQCEQNKNEDIRVVVGEEKSCPSEVCNGALEPDTTYYFQAYMCTNAGCTYSFVSSEHRTSRLPETEDDITGVAAGVVVTFLLAVLGAGAAFYVYRKRRRRPKKIEKRDPETNVQILEEICRNRPVRLENFPEHVEELHGDYNLGFSDEYKLIKDTCKEYPTKIAELPVCKSKNRYYNILPYDHTRVKLLPTDDEEGSDYINANYLPGVNGRREYIAAQGPLPGTVDDFWRMVWENHVSIMVMLTQCIEKGKVKCEQYWPDQEDPKYIGDLLVQIRSESVLPDYIIRVIDVKLGNQTRMIKHFHFMRWPDHGCPEKTSMLLNFVSAVRAHMPRPSSGPILVHCSAGVGRTGTYIALDQLLQQITHKDEIDIFGLVLTMREYRTQMVQNENQYIYIHDCLVDALQKDDQDEEEEEEESNEPIEEHVYANCKWTSCDRKMSDSID